MEGLNPDIVAGMGIGRDGDWKDPGVVAGWGLEGTGIGRDVDWKDPDVVAGFEGTLLLLIVPIDDVVDCSD